MGNQYPCKRGPSYWGVYICIVLCSILFNTESTAQRPTISSFIPSSGVVGTTITIKGNNFNNSPSKNIVYFGSVKALVQSASVTELVVTVPPGAANKSITVTNTINGLTAYSSKPFRVTFPGGDNYLSQSSFDTQVTAVLQNSPREIAIGDLDGDGKPDVVAIGDFGGSGYYLSIVRNTSSPRHLSFAQSVDSTYPSFNGWALALADLNGDGLLDLITSSSQTLSVYKNISTLGNIRFSLAYATSAIGAYAYGLEVGDMDNDGKTDLVFASGNHALTVMRNVSSIDSIMFAQAEAVFPPPSYPGDNLRVKVADFDEDGKADVAMVYTYVDTVVVLHSNSTPGNIAFDQVFKYNAGGGSRPADLCVADMDGDGRVDISYTNNEDNHITILRNITTPGNLNFEPYGGYGFVYHSFNIIDGDFNGDGKSDLAFQGFISPFPGDLAIVLNNSVPCNSNFTSTAVIDEGAMDMALRDMDGDGKPDLVMGKNIQNSIGVRRNNVSQQIRSCAGDSIILPAAIGGQNFQWQQNLGAGFTNINDDAVFSGTNGSFLHIRNIPASFDASTYRCIAGSDTSNVLSLFVNTTLVPSISIGDCPRPQCSGDPATVIYATGLNAGSSPIYQWQDSTDAQGWKTIYQGSHDSLHYQSTVDGAKLRCILRSSSPCATPDSALSNTVTLRVLTSATPAISIAGVTTVNPGDTTTITATLTNAGFWPQYQWQDSTSAVGWTNLVGANNAKIIYIPAKAGDKIRCILRGADHCAVPKIVYSNALAFTTVITAVDPEPSSNYGIHFFPNPAYTILNIDGLKLTDNWQTMKIFNLSGQQVITVPLNGVTSKSINVGSISSGIYLIALKKKDNQLAYYKFVKL